MAIVIERYSPEQMDAAVMLLAAAFVTNPLHVSALGSNRMDHNRLFFRIGLRRMFTGQSFVATEGGKIRGFMHFNASPYCRPLPEEIPLTVASLVKALGDRLPQVMKWLARWCHLDPEEPHIHFGPIAVAPDLQGQGIGTALMKRYIEHLQQQRAAGYLETDREQNVGFYKTFGFAVQHEEELIGARTWYMWRPRPLGQPGG